MQTNLVGAVALRVTILAFLFMFALNMWILRWTFELRAKKCACAVNSKLTYIQFALIASLALFVINPILFRMLPMAAHAALGLGVMAMSIAYLVVTFIYLRDLQKAKDCKCSEGPERTAFYWVNWINIVTTTLAIVGLSYVAYKFGPFIRLMVEQAQIK